MKFTKGGKDVRFRRRDEASMPLFFGNRRHILRREPAFETCAGYLDVAKIAVCGAEVDNPPGAGSAEGFGFFKG